MAFPVVNFPAVHHIRVFLYHGSSGYTRMAISQRKTNVTQMWCERILTLVASHRLFTFAEPEPEEPDGLSL